MAFGFLVEKFDPFLKITSESLAVRIPPTGGQIVGNVAGLLLIVLGGAMMAHAMIRLRKIALDIDAKEVRWGTGAWLDLTLVTPGATLFVYLVYTMTRL